jgi:hypothetical protein
MRRIAMLLVLFGASCTTATVPGPVLSRWDGRYYGQAVADGSGVECDAGSTALRITVEAGRAWTGARRRRHGMDGTVNADGQITLQDWTASHILRGTISGDQLSGVEERPRRRGVTSTTPGLNMICAAVVTATRLRRGRGGDPEAD